MRGYALLVVSVAILVVGILPSAAADQSYIWIEGENPAQTPDIKPPENNPDARGYGFSGWGRKQLISGGSMLHMQIGRKAVKERLGEAGAVFGYEFDVDKPGDYTLWARIGYEKARSPFDWQLDESKWTTVTARDFTVNLVPLQRWNELGWLKLGTARLDEGQHALRFRHKPYTVTRKGKEQPGRILHTLDAICIHAGTFRPNGHRKPDGDYRDEKDIEAARKVFEMPAAGSHRPEVDLGGLWETARWDERTYDPETRLEGPKELPDLEELYWFGIDVPHRNRNNEIPEHTFSHRFLLRTRVDVPKALEGRGFVLDCQGFRMIASVFVNGEFCGWSRHFDIDQTFDLTGAIKPGEVNEIVVAIKSEHYALDPDNARGENPAEWLRGRVNTPWGMRDTQSLGRLYDMPVASHCGPGIRKPLRLLAVGEVWTENVFARPSHQDKQLAVGVTVRNGGDKDREVVVENKVYRWSKDGLAENPEKTFSSRKISVAGGEEATFQLTESWEDPALWFPDDPNLYTIVTTLSDGDQLIDTKRTRFGFREITYDGDGFYINGVPWQFWSDLNSFGGIDAFIERAKKTGRNYMRYRCRHPSDDLYTFDENGIMVRDSGVFDGQMMNYGPGVVERIDGKKTWNRDLFRHVAEHARAWVRARRNHPCILFWSLENEITFINIKNLGQSPVAEPGIRWIAEQMMEEDPTRPATIDGGRALMPPEKWKNAPQEVVELGHLPVSGCHYNGRPFRTYPDAAYSAEYWYNNLQRDRWPMLRDRPITHGEIFFASGHKPADLAELGGERCFLGPSQTWPARDLMQRFLFEGMRWSNSSHAMHTWTVKSTRDYWHAWSPVALFTREWNRAFGSGQIVTRTARIINSTSKDSPITAAWELVLEGKTVDSGKRTAEVSRGGRSETFPIKLDIPRVSELKPGKLILTATREGEEVFHEEKDISIINTGSAPRPDASQGDIVVLDPSGEAKNRLRERGVDFTEVGSVGEIPLEPQTVIIGRNAIAEERAADLFWQHLLLAGARLVVLEQQHPLHYQAVPADLDLSEYSGSIAFGENFKHPALHGLNQDAFFCWANEDNRHRTYALPYGKASQGARSLVQCGPQLNFSAMVECRMKDGSMLLSQLLIGESMDTNPVARRLFDNMVYYASSFEATHKETAVVMPEDDLRTGLLRQIHLDFASFGDPIEALDSNRQIVIVDGAAENTDALAANQGKVRAFTDGGGWLILWGVTPEGLDDYNKLVGVDHVMRRFLREKVILAIPEDPLTAGLSLQDVTMDTGESPTRFWNVPWAVNDAYTWIVDLRDIAPFMDFSGREDAIRRAKTKTQHQSNPMNMFNGFTAKQYWKYLYYIPFEGEEHALEFTLPRRESLTRLSVVPNDHLWQPRTLELYPDDADEPVELPLKVGAFQQDFDLDGLTAKKLDIVLTDLENVNPDRPQHITGIENLKILAKRSEQWEEKVRPLLNIGGLVAYNMGEGGILLNQLNIKKRELNPATVKKKQAMVKTILANLGAVVGGAKPVVVGTNLEFRPVDIPDETYNAYNMHRENPGWFRSRLARNADLSGLPEGENRFEGVLYSVPEFKTSIVPSVIMLRGSGTQVQAKKVEGIKVGRQADALFFLHTYNKGRGVQRYERALAAGNRKKADPENPPVLFRYRVNYADGQGMEVPVRWNEGVSHWLQQNPRPLQQAQVAWIAPVEGHEGWQTTVYSMQWNNPRTDVPIKSIDILPATGRRAQRLGAPAVIAITTATAP